LNDLGLNPQCWQSWFLLGATEIGFLASSVSRSCLHSLTHGLFLASVVMSPTTESDLLLLIRMLVVLLGPRVILDNTPSSTPKPHHQSSPLVR
jgi:hypothetical protein